MDVSELERSGALDGDGRLHATRSGALALFVKH
jgi:hypothetical protein